MAILSYGQVGWRSAAVAPSSGQDADALAFITAAVITNTTQQNAINTLVTDLKGYGIWTKMKAIYPFVGGTASQHKFNLKDPRDLDAAYRLVFNGGWTHSSTGALPNGTTAYADTRLTPQFNLTQNNSHLSFYSRSNTAGADRVSMGSTNSPGFTTSHQIYLRYLDNNFYGIIDSNTAFAQFSNTNTTGYYVVSRASNNSIKAYKNSSLVVTNTNTITPITNSYSIFIGARNNAFTPQHYDDKESAFASIGDGLTDTEAANFYTAVQKFETTLGRQVGTPIVSDTDAQAFVNAAVITDVTQANAINTLVSDLKTANIWTKMKAIYPFVGGTATTHKFNLKDPRDLDAAYRITFNGGWTHSATGVLPNGTTGYANTFLAPNVMGQNDIHVSFYSRTDITRTSPDISSWAGLSIGGINVYPKAATGNIAYYLNDNTNKGISAPSSTGLYTVTRLTSTTADMFRNGVKIVNGTATSTTPSAYKIYLGAENNGGSAGSFSTREQAFATIGDGLTDAEAAAFYTAVQAYQTSLSRNV